MYKLIAVTLAALYAILMIFGDPEATPAVARAETVDQDESRFSVSELLQPSAASAAVAVASLNGPSEEEAIEMAMQAAKDWRANREGGVALRGMVNAIEAVPEATEVATAATDADTWYVTGSTVNLRQGPSTSTSVIGQVRLGDAATTLTDTDADWIQIRTATGDTGWIFSRFLDANRPG